MTIKIESRGELNGVPGTSVTTVEAESRKEFFKSNAGIATGGKAMSMAELLGEGAADTVLMNRFTGSEMRFTREEILAAFTDKDLSNCFLNIKTVFRPDPDQRVYASDMVETMRQSGVSESDIANLLEQEKKSRK